MGKFSSLEAFIAVAEAGSFIGAARTLRLSRSVVSERVRQLETTLQTPLFHRTTRVVRMSDAGHAIFHDAKDLVQKMADIENRHTSGGDTLSGRLRISCVTDFGTRHIAPLVSEFSRRHADVQLDIVIDNHAISPIPSGFDLVIHMRHPQSAGVIERKILSIESVYCAAPSYLAKHPQIKRPSNLRDHRCIGYSFQPDAGEWDFQHPTRPAQKVKIAVAMSSSSGHVQRHLALDGHGVAVLPLYMVWKDLKEGRLQTVLGNWHPPNLVLSGVYPTTHALTKKITMFLDYLCSALPETSQNWQAVDDKVDTTHL